MESGAVYQEFQRDLDRLARELAGRPGEEILRLCLLALEREELVSVGYRESLMAVRLSSMPIPDRVRQVIRHSLVWIWKDEEMHSIYIRGAILRLGGFRALPPGACPPPARGHRRLAPAAHRRGGSLDGLAQGGGSLEGHRRVHDHLSPPVKARGGFKRP